MLESIVTYSGVVAAFVLFMDRLSKATSWKADDKIVGWLHKLATILGIRVPESED